MLPDAWPVLPSWAYELDDDLDIEEWDDVDLDAFDRNERSRRRPEDEQ